MEHCKQLAGRLPAARYAELAKRITLDRDGLVNALAGMFHPCHWPAPLHTLLLRYALAC